MGEFLSADEKLEELTTILKELKRKGKFVDVQICPRCKSIKVRRVGSMSGDMSGHWAFSSPKYECPDCGWRGRLRLYATNRPLDKKQVALVQTSCDKEKLE